VLAIHSKQTSNEQFLTVWTFCSAYVNGRIQDFSHVTAVSETKKINSTKNVNQLKGVLKILIY